MPRQGYLPPIGPRQQWLPDSIGTVTAGSAAGSPARGGQPASDLPLLLGHAVAFIAVFWATPLLSYSAAHFLKYLFTACTIAVLLVLALRHRAVYRAPVFLWLPVLLSIIGTGTLLYAWTNKSLNAQTYASGLSPMILCAIPLLTPSRSTTVRGPAVARFLLMMFLAFSIGHVLGHAIGRFADFNPREFHEQSFVIVFYILLAAFLRRRRHLVLGLALAATSLRLRPSSTLIIGVTLALVAVLLYHFVSRRTFRLALLILLSTIIVVNLGILIDTRFSDAIFGIEPFFKEQVLGGKTNSEFRLALAYNVHDEFYKRGPWVGSLFNGDVNIRIDDRAPWWVQGGIPENRGYAPIHSDFQMFALQGGILGYLLFIWIFLSFVTFATGFPHARGGRGGPPDTMTPALLSAFAAATVVFALYISFNPIMQTIEFSAFFLMLLPVAVMLVRSEGLEAARQRSSTFVGRWTAGSAIGASTGVIVASRRGVIVSRGPPSATAAETG